MRFRMPVRSSARFAKRRTPAINRMIVERANGPTRFCPSFLAGSYKALCTQVTHTLVSRAVFATRPVTLADAIGQTIEVPEPASRIVDRGIGGEPLGFHCCFYVRTGEPY
jgi:hypothetical protein